MMSKAFLVVVALMGCTRPNPAFCDVDEDCSNGFRCNENHSCVEMVGECDLNEDCIDPGRLVCGDDHVCYQCVVTADCVDPQRPLCGEDRACHECVLDDDCTSGVCRADGACEQAELVLYVAPNGISSGECPLEAPCDISFAKSKVSATRSSIRLANGTYALASDFLVDANPITVVGGRAAVLQRSSNGPSFEVRNGSALTLRGFSLDKGVECTNATLVIARLAFDNPALVDTRSWVTAVGCAVDVVDADLTDSTQHGIKVSTGSLNMANTRIEGSLGNGLLCTTSTCSIATSTINRSQLLGVDATPLALQLSRSSLTENRQGGVRSIGGTCDIKNNFVFRNGNDGDATFGGLRLEPTAGGNNRIEHNTIVFNECDPFASPAFAGGLFCTNALAPNNLIYNNFAGNNTMPNSQIGGGCNLTGSLVVNGDGTNEMHFVAPVTAPFDYHLADVLSPAANAGTPGPVTEDFDGDARVGTPDIGADEFAP
jgi:hypothetical protein